MTTPFASKAEERRVMRLRASKALKTTKPIQKRTMTHEERIKLIMKPFPQVRIIGRTGGWYGVSLTQRSIDVHKFLRGLVPPRKNAE